MKHISQGLPDFHLEVLVCDYRTGEFNIAQHIDGAWISTITGEPCGYEPTHWEELPIASELLVPGVFGETVIARGALKR